MQRVERGDLVVGGLDADTAGPTRRIVNFVIWLFALAIAYPFLPGANSEAFKGVSVLAGLMLSLGASSVVGQIISGLSLMYSRTLRTGEYVKIGDTEGTVTVVGMFATKIHTGLGEEVSLPNAVVFSQPVRNFSRLVQDGQFVLHTAVTIGYATPWRQVHAMLLEAARRVARHRAEPAALRGADGLVGLLRRVPAVRAEQPQRAAPSRRGDEPVARPDPGRVQRERRADHVAALPVRPGRAAGGAARGLVARAGRHAPGPGNARALMRGSGATVVGATRRQPDLVTRLLHPAGAGT